MTQKYPVTQPAWDIFCRGDLAGAEQAAAAAMGKLPGMAVHPIPDIMVLKAFYMLRLSRPVEARSLFGRVLEICPDDPCAREGYILALNDELESRAKELNCVDERSTSGRLIIGIGTGRSGSTTLTKLLSHQAGCYSSHEHPPMLPWKLNQNRLEYHMRRFALLTKYYDYVADISHWWLPYVEVLIDTYRNVRVIALKRDRASTIESFLKIKGGLEKGAINHWMDHDGSFWAKNAWDECYPKYKVNGINQALGEYWDDYYSQVDRLCKSYPANIKLFSTETLGQLSTQRDLLSFCGFDNPEAIENLCLNQGGATDGVHLY